MPYGAAFGAHFERHLGASDAAAVSYASDSHTVVSSAAMLSPADSLAASAASAASFNAAGNEPWAVSPGMTPMEWSSPSNTNAARMHSPPQRAMMQHAGQLSHAVSAPNLLSGFTPPPPGYARRGSLILSPSSPSTRMSRLTMESPGSRSGGGLSGGSSGRFNSSSSRGTTLRRRRSSSSPEVHNMLSEAAVSQAAAAVGPPTDTMAEHGSDNPFAYLSSPLPELQEQEMHDLLDVRRKEKAS